MYLPLTIQMLIENNFLRQNVLFLGYYGSLVARDYLHCIYYTSIDSHLNRRENIRPTRNGRLLSFVIYLILCKVI